MFSHTCIHLTNDTEDHCSKVPTKMAITRTTDIMTFLYISCTSMKLMNTFMNSVVTV